MNVFIALKGTQFFYFIQLIPKRTSMETRKGRVGYDSNNPNKVMYVLVGRLLGRYLGSSVAG